MFEKYDGVRGFWNPSKRTFYSRQGTPFDIPQEIVDSMPNDLFLDGELWYALNPTTSYSHISSKSYSLLFSFRFGRGSFQEALKLATRKFTAHVEWSKFKYMVFDAPNQNMPYSQRYALLGTPLFLPAASSNNLRPL